MLVESIKTSPTTSKVLLPVRTKPAGAFPELNMSSLLMLTFPELSANVTISPFIIT